MLNNHTKALLNKIDNLDKKLSNNQNSIWDRLGKMERAQEKRTSEFDQRLLALESGTLDNSSQERKLNTLAELIDGQMREMSQVSQRQESMFIHTQRRTPNMVYKNWTKLYFK